MCIRYLICILSFVSSSAWASYSWCPPVGVGCLKADTIESLRQEFFSWHANERLAASKLDLDYVELVVAVSSPWTAYGEEGLCLYMFDNMAGDELVDVIERKGVVSIQCGESTVTHIRINQIRYMDSKQYFVVYSVSCGALCGGVFKAVISVNEEKEGYALDSHETLRIR